MPAPFVTTLENAPRPLNVVGEHITVLASGAQTGSYEVFRQAGPEGSGPPPHRHPWDESFYVTRGEIAFGIDERETVAVRAVVLLMDAVRLAVRIEATEIAVNSPASLMSA